MKANRRSDTIMGDDCTNMRETNRQPLYIREDNEIKNQERRQGTGKVRTFYHDINRIYIGVFSETGKD